MNSIPPFAANFASVHITIICCPSCAANFKLEEAKEPIYPDKLLGTFKCYLCLVPFKESFKSFEVDHKEIDGMKKLVNRDSNIKNILDK